MAMRWIAVFALGALALGCSSGRTLPMTNTELQYEHYVNPAEAQEVAVSFESLRDDARSRTIPIKIFAPASGDGPFPLIVFSHGLGSSRQGYAYLGRAWASRGYVVIHPQHLGSDSEILREHGFLGIYRAAYNGAEYVDRPNDITFLLDEIERRQQTSGPWSRIDMTRVAVAGHSYGAHTALLVSGMIMNVPKQSPASFRDERIRAALILSPPNMDWSPSPKEFAPIRIPTMHMSGTKDTSLIWRTRLRHRRRAFDSIENAPRYFLNIAGADHNTFSDRETVRDAKQNGRLDRVAEPKFPPRSSRDERWIAMIQELSTAFWDAWLKDSGDAKRWLSSVHPAGATLEVGRAIQ